MAVIENSVTEDGDVLIIKPETPIVGLLALTQFVDTTENESDTDYFLKQFRYSTNGGLTYSDWAELNLISIADVTITAYDQFIIEYKYTRVGDTEDVDLTFNNILVSGEIEDLPYPIYNESIFKQFFEVNDTNVFGWALNVLEKVYMKGMILPDYLKRQENEDNLDDEDFIVFWNSITHLFAIIVYYARQFEDFETNETLLTEFLNSKDLIFPYEESTADLLYLYQNYVAEYKKRGTLAIIDKKSDGADIDGELLRLINYQEDEEFMFSLFRNYDNGWCIGKSSPTWRGTENITNLIKGYEYQNEVQDLSYYPLLNDSYISIVDGNMQITGVPSGTFSGIDYDSDTSKMIIVDPSQDYEISFRISQSEDVGDIVFGVRMYDKDDNSVYCTDITDGTSNSFFLYKKSLTLQNQEYWIRGVLYNSSQSIDSTSVLNTGDGNNLRMPSDAAKLVLFLGMSSSSSTDALLINSVVIRPRKLNFSRGQFGIHNLIYMIARNNNGKYTETKIESIIKEKLINYNSFLQVNWLGDNVDETEDEDGDNIIS
jgi:hypothetical protein